MIFEEKGTEINSSKEEEKEDEIVIGLCERMGVGVEDGPDHLFERMREIFSTNPPSEIREEEEGKREGQDWIRELDNQVRDQIKE